MINWQKPAITRPTSGRIVIHSDDGKLPDYTYYFPIIKRQITKYNQFNPLKSGVFNPAINSGYVDEGFHKVDNMPMMTWDMVKEIQDSGGEILSHGKYHLYFDYTSPSQNITAGDSAIYYTMSQARPQEGFKFYITEGANTDYYTVESYVDDDVNNHMTITPPVQNSYTTAARIYLQEESIIENVKGLIDQCAEHGVIVKNQVNPWYNNSPEARVVFEEYLDSVVTNWLENSVQEPSLIDVYDIKRTKDLRSWSYGEIDLLLDRVQDGDKVGFVQLHGLLGNKKMLENIEYLVGQAMQRGVQIVTHAKALEYIKSKQ